MHGLLANAYEAYQRVPLLAQLASGGGKFIPGSGARPSPLMVIGDYPGIEEAELGVPFAGEAAELLHREMGSCHLPAEFAFFTLAVKYRAPGGREPYPFEVEASRPCLIEEILVVRPVVIAALGDASLLALGAEPGKWGSWRTFTAPGVDWDCHLMPLPSLRDSLEQIEVQMELVHGLEIIGGTGG